VDISCAEIYQNLKNNLEVTEKIQLAPKVNYAVHCTEVHEIHSYLTALLTEHLDHISPTSVK
jgi:hypothetical protein